MCLPSKFSSSKTSVPLQSFFFFEHRTWKKQNGRLCLLVTGFVPILQESLITLLPYINTHTQLDSVVFFPNPTFILTSGNVQSWCFCWWFLPSPLFFFHPFLSAKAIHGDTAYHSFFALFANAPAQPHTSFPELSISPFAFCHISLWAYLESGRQWKILFQKLDAERERERERKVSRHF